MDQLFGMDTLATTNKPLSWKDTMLNTHDMTRCKQLTASEGERTSTAKRSSLIEHVAASSDATLVPSWVRCQIGFQKSHQAQTHMILTTKSG